MTINEQELQEVLRSLDEFQNSISDRKLRRRVMRKPAKIVVNAARPKVPRSKKIHYRYSTPKVVKRRRTAKGSGVIVAAYVPGNLRKSIKRLNFRKSFREFVGPKLRKGNTKGVFGLNATKVDGYYAAMMAGSEQAFRKRFLEPALTANARRILKTAEQELDKEIAKLKKETGL